MKQHKEDLEAILENGLSDVDISDPYQVLAKVNMHFLTCRFCGVILDLHDHGLPIEITDFKLAASLIKSAGWGLPPRACGDTECFEVEAYCPRCFRDSNTRPKHQD